MPTQKLVEMLRSFRTNRENFFKYLDELETAFNLLEPEIQAFIPEEDRFKRIRTEATALFDQYPDPDSRPALFGLLIGVKDIYYVDGFPTKAGSKLPERLFRGQQSHIVSKMRTAGALVLGKTVTTEFAYFSPGPTRNPHNLEHTPGGSSSGSAAAVAAGLVPFATGTQTIGSISRPASFCGVTGFKPSFGRLSTHGVIPLSPSVDHTGYFTEDTPSSLFIAEFLVDHWNKDLYQPSKPKLGIPTGPYLENATEEMLNHFSSTCQKLSEAGYIVKSVNVMEKFEKIREAHNTIVAADAYAIHQDWYQRHKDLYHPKTIELLMRGRNIGMEELIEALTGREQVRLELNQAANENGVDLWLSPGAPGPAPIGLDSTGDPVMNLPWTYTGVPTVCINSGKNDEGLPLGLQISGTFNQDEVLLNWTTTLEQELARRIE
jgi:Asp-tRNA(Asn)/Glu-tRNA(Gln) amidotransferase A subunit family amidase